MSHSSKLFKLLPDWYQDFAEAVTSGKPLTYCLEILMTQMQSREQLVFCQQLTYDEYEEEIAELKTYCELVFAETSQFITQIDATFSSFQKDYSEWRLLDQIFLITAAHEKKYKDINYFKTVKQALLPLQQVEQDEVAKWLEQFTTVLEAPVTTSNTEHAKLIEPFKRLIKQLIQEWHELYQLNRHEQNAAPVANEIADGSFARSFFRVGAMISLLVQGARAAGVEIKSVTRQVQAKNEGNVAAHANKANTLPVTTTANFQPAPPTKTNQKTTVVLQEPARQNAALPQNYLNPTIIKSNVAVLTSIYQLGAKHKTAGTPHQIAIANQGFQPVPKQIIKYNRGDESKELREDNYFFVDEAIEQPFYSNMLPRKMLQELYNDINYNAPQATNVIDDLLSSKLSALHHVAFGYMYGSALLSVNNHKALQWASVAARAGSVLAAHYLAERLYPDPDRSYELLVLQILPVQTYTPEKMATITRDFKQECEEYLKIAAYYGYCRASEMLGRAYLYGYFGEKDPAKALHYFAQAVVQAPDDARHYVGAIHAALEILNPYQLSWNTFDADAYLKTYEKISKVVKTLSAVTALTDELITKRVLMQQHKAQSSHLAESSRQIERDTVFSCRTALHKARAKLSTLTLQLDAPHVLPSRAKLEALGVRFGKSNAESSRDSLQLADKYFKGNGVQQDLELASYFCRQALKDATEPQLVLSIMNKQIAIDEKRLHLIMDNMILIASNPFNADEVMAILHQMPEEKTFAFGIQVPAKQDKRVWSIRCVGKHQHLVSTSMLSDLLKDTQALAPHIRDEYRHIHSALQDGDLSGITRVLELYEDNPGKRKHWVYLASVHGHISSLREWGNIAYADVDIGGRVERVAAAAALGDARATYEMLRLAENNQLNGSVVGLTNDQLVAYYRTQCYLQDPKLALQLLKPALPLNAMKAALVSQGFNRYKVQNIKIDLNWNPIKRNGSDEIMNDLFALLTEHHPDNAAVNQIKKAFSEGSQTCFMQVAQYYATVPEIKDLNRVSRQLLSILWASMGLRAGDITTGMHINRVFLDADKNVPIPAELVQLLERVYESVNRWKNGEAGYAAVPRSEYITTLVHDALMFSACHGDADASAHLAGEYASIAVETSDLHKLGTTRMMWIQAIAQARYPAKMCYRYCDITLLQLQEYIKHFAHVNADNLRFLEMHEHGFQKMKTELKSFIDLYDLKVRRAQLTTQSTMETADELYRRLDALSAQSLLTPYEEAGVQIRVRHELFNGMIRKHQPWELLDASLVSRANDYTLSGQYYLRAITLQKLTNVVGDKIHEKLRDHMLDDPADMLHIRDLCLQQAAPEFARAWLLHAVRAGSVVARRIQLLEGNHTHEQLAEVARYGDPEALFLLAESAQTNEHYKPSLFAQAEFHLDKYTKANRKLYLRRNITRKKAPADNEEQIQNYTRVISNIVMFVCILVPLLILSKLYSGCRGMITRRNAEQQRILNETLTLFRAMNYIKVEYDGVMKQFIATMQGESEKLYAVHGMKLTQDDQFTCNAVENTNQLMPMLENAKVFLKQTGVIDDSSSLTTEKLLDLLQIKRRVDKQKNYSYASKSHDSLRVDLPYQNQCELFECFARFSGYEVTAGANQTYLLKVKTDASAQHSKARSFVCKALWNAMLNQKKLELEKKLALEKQKDDAKSELEKRHKQALVLLNKYSAEAKTRLNELENFRQAMVNEHCKTAEDIILLCDALRDMLLTCNAVKDSEDKAGVIDFEKTLSTALKLMNENHPLRVKLQLERNKRAGRSKDTPVVKPSRFEGTKKREKQVEKTQSVAAKEKQEALSVSLSPATNEAVSATTSVRQREVTQKVTPAIDPDEVDFSEMVCLPLKEKVTFFKAVTIRDQRPAAKPIPDVSLQAWPMDWLKHHRDLLTEIIKDPAFMPDTCKDFRLRALSFRLMELLLFLDKLNENGHGEETDVTGDVKNRKVKNISKRFLNALRHNAHLIDLNSLESCVRECILPNMDNVTGMLTAVSRSSLYKKIVPSKGDVLISRTDDELFADLKRYFDELKSLDALFSKLRMNKKIDEACHDGYRGVIMLIGEIGQRLWVKCPQLKNEIIKRYPDSRKLMYFIVVCHVMHRNKYSHHMDLNAMYESTISKFPFVVDQLHGLILEKVAARGIKAGGSDGIVAAFKTAYLQIAARNGEQQPLSEKEKQDEESLQTSYLDIIKMFDEDEPVNNNNNNNAVMMQRLPYK